MITRTLKLAFAVLIVAISAAAGPIIPRQSDGHKDRPTLSEAELIDGLIRHVGGLRDTTFIRNGKEHTARDAADHMRSKLRFAGDRIKTARDFIEHIASKSSQSGEPYTIRFKDGREISSGEYLTGVLARLQGGVTPPTSSPDDPVRPSVEPLVEQPPAQPHVIADPKAAAVINEMISAMGGWLQWNRAKLLAWRHLGSRLHVWNRETGDIRVEIGGVIDTAKNSSPNAPMNVILMNVRSGKGRAWLAGQEVIEPARLKSLLGVGFNAWANDAHSLVLPYLLRDVTVTPRHVGASRMADGRMAQKLTVTFEPGSLTPDVKYDIWIGENDHLIGQWSVYRKANDSTPQVTESWSNWKLVDGLMLSDTRGGRKHTDIAVFEQLPRSVFTDPAPVDFAAIQAAPIKP